MIRNFVGMRKHLAWYCYDSPRAAELRAQMVRVNRIEEVVQCLRAYAGLLGSQFDPDEAVFQKPDSRIMNAAFSFS
jgi:hypothetical protein